MPKTKSQINQTNQMNNPIIRHQTCSVRVGNLDIGSNHPIRVQSMTNTDTADIAKTVTQIEELSAAGSEFVRVTVNTNEAAAAIPKIVELLEKRDIHTPIIGDFHFNGHRLLKDNPQCAQFLAKLRINPGNVGQGMRKDKQFAEILELALKYAKPVRIGVNWGSLDQSVLARLMDQNHHLEIPLTAAQIMREAMVLSALESAAFARDIGLSENQIVLSVKVSNPQDLIAVYQDLASRSYYPLHLGLTEAGMGMKGIVASTVALSVILQQGIGDTIRISLTPEPGQSRTEEVKVGREILQSLNIRAFSPKVTACPGCGRTSSDYFQHLALNIQNYLDAQMPIWKDQYIGVENLNVAVMGCVVNGPGESKLANIGISLPGSGEIPVAPVYEDGQKTVTLKGEHIATEFQALVNAYIQKTYIQK